MAAVQPPSDTHGNPPFPDTVPTAPLLRISLQKLLQHDVEEEDRFWSACCDLGFFYLDLRTSSDHVNGDVDGEGLLRDADALFEVAREFFDLPVEEKVKYDFSEERSYFGLVFALSYIFCFSMTIFSLCVLLIIMAMLGVFMN